MVMAHHALMPHTWLDGARGSVDLFFAVSGFLITSLVVGEFDRNGRIDRKAFYRRRAFRLLPALAVFVVGIAAYAGFLRISSGDSPVDTLRALGFAVFYVTNWAWAFGAHLPIQFIHLWTLAVEEQFYLLAPLALGLALPRWRRTAIIRVLLAVAVVGVAWRAYLFADGADWPRLRFGLDVHADALLVGCMLGVAYASGLAPRLFSASNTKKWIGNGIVAAFLLMTFLDMHAWAGQEWWAPAVWAVMAGVAVCSVVGQIDGAHVRFLESRVVQRIGKISYGLYLWHLPVQLYIARALGADTPQVVRIAVAWAIAYVLAELSYRIIEMPAQEWRKRRDRARQSGSPVGGPVVLEELTPLMGA